MKTILLQRLLLLLMVLPLTHAAHAEESDTIQRYEFGIDYTGEFQTDFQGSYNFLNLLRLDGTVNITSNLHINVSTLSIAKAKDSMLSDLQVFSNLETEEGIPITLAVAGMEWDLPTGTGTHTFFAGIRNTGEDYFASDITAFFINSSCGIFPTISANFPIATYPCAAMCLHYAYDHPRWGAKATIYNGTGAYEFSGRENIFRICPQSDGLFCMAQGKYKHHSNSYFLGGSLYKSSPTLWTYTEQSIFNTPSTTLHLLASYSHSFSSDTLCRNFGGIGAKLRLHSTEFGIFTDYADFGVQHEYATELSVKTPICKYIYLHPAMHYINGSAGKNIVGMLRFGFSL